MIESHKLKYHPEVVSKFLNGETIYPIYVEITPSNACNHRCTFCAYDYTGYKKRNLDTDTLKITLKELSELGAKSVMYAGEGEPLLHPDIIELINYTKHVGLDVATQTNGVLATQEFFESCIDSLSWIKFSIDAGTKETHSMVHGTQQKDFDIIIDNLKNGIKIRDKHKSKCIIGSQMIMLEENYREAERLCDILESIDVDYLILKPFSKHPLMKMEVNPISKNIVQSLIDRFNDVNWIQIRDDTYNKIIGDREYRECLGHEFATWIDSKGDVYLCSSYLGNKNFVYGNIYKSTFKEIWDNKTIPNININECRKGCRIDKVNQYLWDLKHPPQHCNFI